MVMPIASETLKPEIDRLTNEQLQEVADFIAFLKFRDKRRRVVLDPAQLTSLATEFAEEDRTLAEAGMGDYAAMLDRED
ncbi:Programmed cell death antitoxin YdcD [Geitlerinema sp. FC II]|nr:Programmed cell death antitoxin YdcD [Geitlerinema sp. FC II]